MRHSFLDKYSERDSVVHRLDPRTKIVLFLLYVVLVVLTLPGAYESLAGYLALIIAVAALSKVPFGYILVRSLVIVPFVLMVGLFNTVFSSGGLPGREVAAAAGKAWLAVVAMVLLSSSTRFTDLLKGLERLRVPRVLLMLLSFMYRYVFILMDEVMRMERARRSRSFGRGSLRQFRALGNIIGNIFLRTYERGERVYLSMVSRGFDGEIRTLRRRSFAATDGVFSVLFIGGLIVSTWWRT